MLLFVQNSSSNSKECGYELVISCQSFMISLIDQSEMEKTKDSFL